MKRRTRLRNLALLAAGLVAAAAPTPGFTQNCLPTCQEDDGRVLSLTDGAGLATLTGALVKITLSSPACTASGAAMPHRVCTVRDG